MAGQDLLHERAAGAGHADNEIGTGEGSPPWPDGPTIRRRTFRESAETLALAASGRIQFRGARRVPLLPLGKGAIVLADVLQGFAQGKVTKTLLFWGRRAGLVNVELDQLGIAGTKRRDVGPIVMGRDQIGF